MLLTAAGCVRRRAEEADLLDLPVDKRDLIANYERPRWAGVVPGMGWVQH